MTPEQVLQLEDPTTAFCPLGQRSQTTARVVEEKWLRGQSGHSAAVPLPEVFPGVQSLHLSAAESPDAYFPAAQFWHEEEPISESPVLANFPAVQGRH